MNMRRIHLALFWAPFLKREVSISFGNYILAKCSISIDNLQM
jgi:hypothetical protein